MCLPVLSLLKGSKVFVRPHPPCEIGHHWQYRGKKSTTWETLTEDIEPIPMKIKHNEVPYQKSQEVRKCWRVCVIPAWLILVPCGEEDHDHSQMKNLSFTWL